MGPALAYVILERAVSLDANAVVEGLRAAGADAALEASSPALSIVSGGETFAISVIDAPFPWSDLEGPCSTAWWWPEATARCRPARAHAIVAAVGAASDAIDSRLGLTRVVAALLRSSPLAVGVYWGGAACIVATDEFLSHAARASRDRVPLPIWVDLRIERDPRAGWRCVTTGLRALDLMEVEAFGDTEDPRELADVVLAAAHYVCDNGPVLEAGQTFGRSGEEQLTIAHGASVWQRAGPVLRLTAPRPWVR